MSKSITIELDDRAAIALLMWSMKKKMSQEGIMRQALKLYDLNSHAVEADMEMVFRNKNTKKVFENWPLGGPYGCPALD